MRSTSLIVIGTIALIVWAMPRDKETNFKVERGKPWRYADFTAPFDFPIYKSDELIKKERDSLTKTFEPYYNYNPSTGTNLIKQFKQDYPNGIPGIPAGSIEVITSHLQQLYEQGIMNSSEHNKLRKDTTKFIRIVNGKRATTVSVNNIYSTVGAYEKLFADPVLAANREQLAKCNLNDYIMANLTYDKERSEAGLEDIISSIPLANGVVQRGEKIIDRGGIIDDHSYDILESYFRESKRRQKDDVQLSHIILGEIIYVGILIICFTIYLRMFRLDYYEKPRSMGMIYALILLFSVVASLMVSHNVLHIYIIPFAMVPIFIRVFMDSRTAFMAHTTQILICAAVLQHPLEFIVVEEVAGLVAIFSLRELSSRSQLFWTAALIAGSTMLANLSLDWIRDNDITQIDYSEFNYLLINGLLLFCSYPLLYIIEKTFNFTSNITLIELSDMNKELLRRMSEVAPGTFQHSIQVGNLAAEIANKIDGKSQLVRTGALYHDIGKIMNPIYFTENQAGINPHEGKTYVESAQMLIGHVTEGLKLAEKHNLPDVIKEFIATHHGLGKTKYFYIKQKNEFPEEEVDDLLFTYPGPNPFTKEQAILMMADAVEAASRSLKEYTEQNIRELVNRIIDTQVDEGYFRECPITFRDIQYAKTVLIEKLKTIYHTRISYPELKK
ncbi:MAG: HDIG domain-containing protein [Bacteroidales bacterium]|nr:HDIG domain-containing protein [Bacteroidales bacterium]